MLIEEIGDARLNVQRWPGPICGPCWRATCACGYYFHDPAVEAALRGRDSAQRLMCAACEAEQPSDAQPPV